MFKSPQTIYKVMKNQSSGCHICATSLLSHQLVDVDRSKCEKNFMPRAWICLLSVGRRGKGPEGQRREQQSSNPGEELSRLPLTIWKARRPRRHLPEQEGQLDMLCRQECQMDRGEQGNRPINPQNRNGYRAHTH